MTKTNAYRFANSIWVEEVIGTALSVPSFVRAAFFSVTPWLIGLAISFQAGVLDRYIATPTFYVGSFGIFLTTIGLVFGASRQYTIYDRLLSSFEIDPGKRREHVLKALSRNSNFWLHVRAAAIIFGIGLAATTVGIFFWDHVRGAAQFAGTYLPRFRALALHGWYEPDTRVPAFLIVVAFLVFISSTLGTSASIILRLPVFLWQVSTETPKLPPAIIKLHFAPAATFYSVISLLWLGGVGLMLYFFGMNKDWMSYAFVAVAFLFGILNLSLPQISYLRTVGASEERYLEIVSARFGALEEAREESVDSSHLPQVGRSDDVSTSTLIGLIKYEEWVYPVHQTYVVVGSYVGSLVITAIGWEKLYAAIAERLG